MNSLTVIFVALSAAVAMADDVPSMNGKWKLHQSIADYESNLVCTFTQKSHELTGSCVGERGSVNISGKVDDKRVNWVYKSDYNASPITLTYEGTMDSKEKMAGTVTVEEYSTTGDFPATQMK